MSLDRDSMLFRRFRDTKDPALLAGLFDRLSPELLLIARRTCGNVADAQDVVQSTFVAAIQRAHAWQEDEPLLPWLVGILVRQAGLVRRTRRSPDATRLFARRPEEPHHSAAGAELDRALTAALAQLDEIYRPVLHLHLRCGMNGREIAQTLGRPHARVRQQLVRGLRRLRAMLPPGLLVCVAARIGSGRGLAAVRQEVQAKARATESGMPLGGAPPASLDSMFLGKQLAAAGLLVGLLVLGWWLTRPPEAAALPAMAVADSTALPGPLLVADTFRSLPAASSAAPSAQEQLVPDVHPVPMSENPMKLPLATFLLPGLAAAQALSWQPAPAGSTPTPPRFVWQSLAFDVGRSNFVLFGGRDDAAVADLGDTWTFNRSTWTQRVVAGPSPRWSPAMSFDIARNETVLFGGTSLTRGLLGDTWAWNGSAWTQRTPSRSPSPRFDCAFATDTLRNRVLLFGGSDATGLLNDTWSWDGSNWTRLTPTVAPFARQRPAMAYDASRDRVVLFGGGTATWLGDTWEFDGNTWTQAAPAVSPPCRDGARLVHVPALGGVLLFGGIDTRVGLFNDTWTFDGVAWRQINALGLTGAPSARDGAGMALDTVTGSLLIVQGRTATAVNPADTWLLHPVPPAAVTPVGVGCAGAGGVPMLSASPGSRPIVGQTLSMQFTNLPLVWTVVLPWIGLSSQTWGPFNLPRSLAVHGMPGCTQYASVDTTYVLLAPTGSIGWQVPIPPLHSLVGQVVHVQALVADPSAGNSLGATVTNAGILQLGGS